MRDDIAPAPRAAVGRDLPHDTARLHVTGQARYVDDIPVPLGCLHLAFALSPVAAGTLNAVDLERSRALPGVHAAWDAGDLGRNPDCSPSAHDEPLLADGTVHYVGQPVALIAADGHHAARRAAASARIDVTEASAILTIDAAEAAGSRFEEGPRVWTRGDVETAILAAPQRITGSLHLGGQEHFYLEGQAALALPQEGGDMVVHASTQHPTEIQHKVADALGVPMHAVRVEVRRMGGGFGGKESQGNALAIACALVAARTGRPVRMRYDRDDDFTITGKRHDARIDYAAGFDRAGRLLGVDVTQHIRCGWAQDLSLPVADRAMLHADNAYFIPAMRVTSHRWRTNTQSATAFRGFGGPQGMVGIERVMDEIAHRLGADPLAVRQVNYYDRPRGPAAATGVRVAAGSQAAPAQDPGVAPAARAPGDDPEAVAPPVPGSAPNAGGTGNAEAAAAPPPVGAPARDTTHFGQRVEDFLLHEMTERLAETADYARRREAVAAWNAANPVLKRGLALTPVKFGISFTLTHLNQAGALVHVYQDGSIAMNHGGTEMGQGLFQKVAQVAASRFGVDPGVVKITATDTGKVPNTSATAASSGSDLNGMAVAAACDTIRDRIAAHLAETHQCSAQEVVFDGGRVRVAADEMSFAEAVKSAYMARVSLSATGFYATPDLSWDRLRGHGRPFFYFAYGCACSEVVLDTLTGENRILRTDILHDAGASLNPALDTGQIEGGFVQGAGWLTMEELVWDEAGRLRTHAPSTYKIPAARDRPEVFNVTLWDQPNPAATIYRSKAVGEPPFMLGISAFLALSDAAAACGPHYPALEAPATPERLMAAVARARGA